MISTQAPMFAPSEKTTNDSFKVVQIEDARRRARLRRLWPLGTGAAILFASLLLLMTLGILGSYRHLKTGDARAGWVVHSEDVLGTSERLLSDLQHAETGQLGYLLTGNSTFLEPYRAGVAAYQHEFDRLVLLTADNSLQQHRLAL